MRRLLVALGLLLLSNARAEDPDTGRAREEIEHQLRQFTKVPPATVEVRFEGINSSRYELVDSDFKFDGKPLPTPLKPGPLGAMKTMVYFELVSPGPHVFEATLIFRQLASASPLFSYVTQYKLRVPYRITLEAQKGLVLRLKTRVIADDSNPDLKGRLRFIGEVEPYLVAKIENTPSPAPPPAEPGPAPVEKKTVVLEKPFTQMATGDWHAKNKRLDETAPGTARIKKKRLERLRKKLRQAPDGGI